MQQRFMGVLTLKHKRSSNKCRKYYWKGIINQDLMLVVKDAIGTHDLECNNYPLLNHNQFFCFQTYKISDSKENLISQINKYNFL